MDIFLDMDGVLSNFVNGILVGIYNLDEQEILDTWPAGEWDVSKVIGKPWEEITQEVNDEGIDFWEGLEMYPDALPIYTLANALGKVRLLTTPMDVKGCLEGKVMWAVINLGTHPDDVIFCKEKHLLARPDAILIDDKQKNIAEFEEAGGLTVTVPRPWNAMGFLEPIGHKYVLETLLATVTEGV